MKLIIIYLIMGITLLTAQDAAGQYKLSGVDVLYTFITRESVTLTVTDAYGLGITQTVTTIPAAVPFHTQAMQLTDTALEAIGINLNITLNEDGSGAIAEGSYYPDVNTIEENGSCVTIQQVLPVTDEFTYTSMGNMMEYVGMVHPGVNVLGLPGISSHAGTLMGGFSLSSSQTFENFPMFPVHPTLCDPSGTDCFPFTVGDIDESGTIEVYPDVNALGIPEYVPGGSPLTGLTAGYFLKRGLNTDDMTSVYPGNTEPDFILEWHGIDGADSDLGWGDDAEVDEDGDGTWFDRQIGIPGITATYMNPACGFNLPIYGDLTGSAYDDAGCIDHVDAAASAYLMDPSGALATWGNFLTANAATMAGTAASLTDISTDPAGIMAACGATGAPTDATAGTCLLAAGATGETPTNTDVLTCLAAAVDATEQTACVTAGAEICIGVCVEAAVVAYVMENNPAILANDSGHDFDGVDGRLTMNFDIPCVPIIEAREVVAEFVEMGENSGCMEENACNYDPEAGTSGYTCVYGSNDVLDDNETPSGSLSPCYIEGECDYDCSGNVLSLIEDRILDRFNLNSIYPNPFNPITTVTFTMPIADKVSIKVFDITGRELITLKEDFTIAGTHTVNWNASNHPSGVYLLQMISGSFSKTQKIVLMK